MKSFEQKETKATKVDRRASRAAKSPTAENTSLSNSADLSLIERFQAYSH